MIKRDYFIYVETDLEDGKRVQSYRQVYWRSWFARPNKVLEYYNREIVEELGRTVEHSIVKAFNRC